MTSTRPGFRSGGILRISARISESRVYDAAVFVPALASQARYRASTSRLRNSDRSRKRAGENSAKGLVVGGAGEGGGGSVEDFLAVRFGFDVEASKPPREESSRLLAKREKLQCTHEGRSRKWKL